MVICDKEGRLKITLISPYENIAANGLRIISAYLKNYGHKVELIFLQAPKLKFSGTYSSEVADDVINLCKASDLIGFSLMSNYFVRVRDLTRRIKSKLDIPVIWGGIHPTVKPEECLEFADMVCIGEGEDAMLELAQKLQPSGTVALKNIWFKKNSKIIKNELLPLEEDLDKYPFQDYDITTHYLLRGGRVVKMNEQLLGEAMPHNSDRGVAAVEYYVMGIRNCPHSCTYCCNNALRRLYSVNKQNRFVRFRTPRNIIDEIESVKNRFPFIKQVLITDDTFFIRGIEEIREFCLYYKEKIGLPFRCYVSPLTITEDKLQLLIDAGLFRISMGVQSYSEQTLTNIYKRPTPRKAILEGLRIINKYKTKLPKPVYHIMVDNPYETKEAKKQNIAFIASLPEGSKVSLFSLVFFPGTELYKMAVRDGIIKDEISDIYGKSWNEYSKRDYLACVLCLCASTLDHFPGMPKSMRLKMFNLLVSDIFVFLFDNAFSLTLILFLLRGPSCFLKGLKQLRKNKI